MKAAGYLLSAILGLLGLMFLIASGQGNALPRVIIGVVLLAAAIAIGVLTRAKAPERQIVQKIDLTGDITPEQLKCNSCGAPLSKDSVTVKAGAIVVSCPYCGTSYQLEEAPKW